MKIRNLEKTDIPKIVSAFENSNWQIKHAELFEQYLHDQTKNKISCFVASYKGEFAGYTTIRFLSKYQFFADNNIPEICDLNILPKYRNRGIGTALIERCEMYANTKSNIIGIGVGFYPDYGNAQKLYVKLGYIPDGFGATYNYNYVSAGKKYPVDDELILWFTKKISW